ncbi:Panacea domain-containing protein [Pseudomonas viridiflava]|uniref:Panacea domain-containing protein n=1 Tax=Pseudomonas viridiflava TaxID=33069 RepID=UPI0013CED670|nr:Panacea domain-containing protein [Pseudomonas viridiflava]
MDGAREVTLIFSEQKVAQMAAFFLARREAPMAHIKLMKLLYLADRLSMERYDAPMSDDSQCNMKNGPILSATLDLMNGSRSSNAWSALISPIRNNEVTLQRNFVWDELDELSRADLAILEEVFANFGHLNRWELVNYVHTLPEWENPGSSSKPIDSEVTFESFGLTKVQAHEKVAMLRTRKLLGQKLAEMS